MRIGKPTLDVEARWILSGTPFCNSDVLTYCVFLFREQAVTKEEATSKTKAITATERKTLRS
jgi:hypothetical protein